MSQEDTSPYFCLDSEEPEIGFSMQPNALLRDETLSPNCRWLIAYLLSNKEGWIIRVSQIIHHLKGQWGRKKVYDVINEAIKAGYMLREEYREGNLIRYRYLISRTPRFKKFLRCVNFGDAEIRDAENGNALRIPKDTSLRSVSKEEQEVSTGAAAPKPPAPSASPRATDLLDFFFEARSKHLPEADTKKKPADAEIFDKLLEKHTEAQIKAVIVFALTDDSFWRGKIINPKQLVFDKNKQATRFVLLKEQLIQTGKRNGNHTQATSPETEDGKPRFKFKRVIRG